MRFDVEGVEGKDRRQRRAQRGLPGVRLAGVLGHAGADRGRTRHDQRAAGLQRCRDILERTSDRLGRRQHERHRAVE